MNNNIINNNQLLLIYEMQKRGITVSKLENNLIWANYQGHQEYINGYNMSIISSLASSITESKHITKNFLYRIGIPTINGYYLEAKDVDKVINCFDTFKNPMVIKPSKSFHGFNVHLNIWTKENVLFCLQKVIDNIGPQEKILIEEYYPVKLYKIYIDINNKYAILSLEPPFIIGDGVSSIEMLMKEKNMSVDEDVLRYLYSNNLSLGSVIQLNKKVFINSNSSINRGAYIKECRYIINSNILDIATHILSKLNTSYVEIDLLTNHIEERLQPNNYKILKLTTNISLNGFMNPDEGCIQNVPKYIIDILFPETKYEDGMLEKNIKSL